MPHKKIGELVLEEKWLTLRELNSLLNDQKKDVLVEQNGKIHILENFLLSKA